jgi:hypothetical protein
VENAVQGPYRDIRTIIQVTVCVVNWDLQFVEKSHIPARPVRYQTGP